MSNILDGKATADKICERLKERLDAIRHSEQLLEDPTLIIVTSGDDAASKVYVRNKVKRCEELGIRADVRHFDIVTPQIVDDIAMEMRPVIFQMPIHGPATIETLQQYDWIDCDMDGFVDLVNVAQVATGKQPTYYPCTPEGIIRLLAEYGITLDGKSVCVIGRSNIVGRPLSWMMEQAGATVTLCHSCTPERTLYQAVAAADIVVAATGVRNILTIDKFLQYASWNAADKVFVDVGINRDENGKLCGDIDKRVLEMSAAHTPVPGGVGPMTVAMLMEHVVQFYERLVMQ